MAQRLLPFLMTLKSGNYKVIHSNSLDAATRAAARWAGADLCDVQAMPTSPEDWHEQEEQLLHTLG